MSSPDSRLSPSNCHNRQFKNLITAKIFSLSLSSYSVSSNAIKPPKNPIKIILSIKNQSFLQSTSFSISMADKLGKGSQKKTPPQKSSTLSPSHQKTTPPNLSPAISDDDEESKSPPKSILKSSTSSSENTTPVRPKKTVIFDFNFYKKITPPRSTTMVDKEKASRNKGKSPVLDDPDLIPNKKGPFSKTPLKLWDNNKDLYVVKKPIGTADPHRTKVYTAAFIPGDPTAISNKKSKPTTVAVKLIEMSENDQRNYNKALEGVRRNQKCKDCINILRINTYFVSQGNFCIVFPYREVSSLRSLLQPETGVGLPENCIKIALRETLNGLISIHSTSGETHREISAGNIFFDHPSSSIKLAFAASVYDPYIIGNSRPDFDTNLPVINEEGNVGTANSEYSAMRLVTKWGRAPEAVDGVRPGQRYEGYTQKSDIWNLGIVALELAYGEIPVKGHQELLDLAAKIREKQRLPNRLWEDKKKEKNVVVGFLKGIWKKKGKRFSKSFGKMVAKCLASDPDKRPTAGELIDHKFFRYCGNVRVFAESVIKNRENDLERGGEDDKEAEEGPSPRFPPLRFN